MRQHGRRAGIGIALAALLIAAGAARVNGQAGEVALAYVWQDTVTLADADGNPLAQTGPTFGYGQGARLLWTPDGGTLYIARDDGLYVTSPEGSPAVRVPGAYGRTLTIAQDAETVYYLETVSPQELEGENAGRVAFPLRETALALLDGSAGRHTGYFGRFEAGAAQANIAFAAALYARDGGLLGAGRPDLWPTYGSNLFGTCCFPNPGLGIYNVGTGEFAIWDTAFRPGAAAVNLTRTHLAGPTTDGSTIRVIDLITGGTRDYLLQIAGGIGEIERVAWSPDDTYLYFASRTPPTTPLTLDKQPGTYTVDPSSADVIVFRLNLVTSVIRELAQRPDVYGVSSLAASDRYVFAVVVDPNTRLVSDLNLRRVRPGAQPTDPDMAKYMPLTHLWRIDAAGDGAQDVADGVWGVAARPIR
jgi:hypothetical protein